VLVLVLVLVMVLWWPIMLPRWSKYNFQVAARLDGWTAGRQLKVELARQEQVSSVAVRCSFRTVQHSSLQVCQCKAEGRKAEGGEGEAVLLAETDSLLEGTGHHLQDGRWLLFEMETVDLSASPLPSPTLAGEDKNRFGEKILGTLTNPICAGVLQLAGLLPPGDMEAPGGNGITAEELKLKFLMTHHLKCSLQVQCCAV
jgi:hypothetical protein